MTTITKEYKVHSSHRTPAPVEVTLPNGSKAVATVDAQEIQLVPVDGASGTVKLVLNDPAEIEAAAAMFVVDRVVEISFTVE